MPGSVPKLVYLLVTGPHFHVDTLWGVAWGLQVAYTTPGLLPSLRDLCDPRDLMASSRMKPGQQDFSKLPGDWQGQPGLRALL